MPKKISPSENERISAVALKLAASYGWTRVTMDAVAKGAKIPFATLKKRFATTCDLIPILAEEIDREAFTGVGKISGTPHEILFDILMARFDVLQKHRKAILSMASAARKKCSLSCAVARATFDGIYRVIDASKIKAPSRLALVLAIGGVYSWAFYAWSKDSSRDMSKTMATLDRALRVVAKTQEFLKKHPRAA